MRIRLELAYDGTDFAGWSRQPGLRTVQGELEAALATITRRAAAPPPTLVVAGRTDAGVHALGQVAHVDLLPEHLAALGRPRRGQPAPPGPDGLARRLTGIAGQAGDLWVATSAVAPAGFDARFSPVWRRYEYRIADAAALHDPLRRRATLWHPGALDEQAMDSAARSLTGLHDWAAFCRPREGATTVRTLLEFCWRRDADGVLIATVRADAFCHSMVRALVGACVAVGAGRMPAERLPLLRDAGERGSEFVVAAARGLTLAAVGYPPDAELAVRAGQTRARREAIAGSGLALTDPSGID
ncbi:MAG: tRNA pseudouridine(38-40) synthase TruA [Micrococcales bacterium]|nr:tRNA pseudouridine(38-40) synthase TruA [Micrococcales bacterium]